jgi:N-terminal acetyltransferase B complex catalytic subunit
MRRKQAYFVDLFVRVSNRVAVDMYKRLGYSVYRRVLEYYSGDPDEDAFGIIIICAIFVNSLLMNV